MAWDGYAMLAWSFLAARHQPSKNYFQMSRLPGGYSSGTDFFLISSFIGNCDSSSNIPIQSFR